MDNIFIRQEKVKLTSALKAIVTQNIDPAAHKYSNCKIFIQD